MQDQISPGVNYHTIPISRSVSGIRCGPSDSPQELLYHTDTECHRIDELAEVTNAVDVDVHNFMPMWGRRIVAGSRSLGATGRTAPKRLLYPRMCAVALED
ncbi:hypothetical protein AB1N83_002337 [Pleurotus pulmonarius]